MDTGSSRDVRSLSPLQGEARRTREAVTQVLRVAPPVPRTTSDAPVPASAPGAPTAATRPPRQAWMDVLRGTAIVLVVLTHVRAQGWRLFGIDETPLNLLVDTFAPIRIPLLMLLSGMLLSRSIAKGPRAFTAGKLRGIAWPYVVWSLVYLGTWQLFPHVDGGFHRTHGLTDIIVSPVSVLWYLHLLVGLYLLALLLLSIPHARPAHLLTLAGTGWLLSSLGESPHLERALCLATFFLAGDLLARRLERGLPTPLTRLWTSPLRRPATFLALLVLASPLLWWAVVLHPTRYTPLSLVPASAAMVLLVLAARASRGRPGERALAWVGRQSLVFYVAHWLVIGAWYAAVDVALEPREQPWLSLVLVLGATLLTCAVVARLQQRWRVAGWLFTAPRRRS
ncbi:acyltransferase [Nocardioidaceae bacterium]|nr:acyltransferase [Nocardioidaceae bacterium]